MCTLPEAILERGLKIGITPLGTVASAAVLVVVVAAWTFREHNPPSPEATAIGALRTLATAQAIYRDRPGPNLRAREVFAPTLALLAATGVIDRGLGSGVKHGYTFRILAADASRWSARADPVNGGGGERHFFVDESGNIRFAVGRSATSGDAMLGQ